MVRQPWRKRQRQRQPEAREAAAAAAASARFSPKPLWLRRLHPLPRLQVTSAPLSRGLLQTQRALVVVATAAARLARSLQAFPWVVRRSLLVCTREGRRNPSNPAGRDLRTRAARLAPGSGVRGGGGKSPIPNPHSLPANPISGIDYLNTMQ